MKKILILALVLIGITVTSCDRENPSEDYLNNRDVTLYFNPQVATLLIEEGEPNIYSVTVNSSAVVDSGVNYSISIDPASTAVEGVDFTMSGTSFSFVNGMVVSNFDVVGDFSNATIAGKTVIFNLMSDSIIGVQDQFTLNLLQFCPIEAPFTGDYQLSIIVNGIFDTPTFTPGVVTISVGNGPTDRFFSVAPYPAFGSFAPIDFNFSLICGDVTVPGLQVTGVGCGSSTTLGPQELLGSYDPTDDSSFTISYADDEGGASCGAQVDATIMLTRI